MVLGPKKLLQLVKTKKLVEGLSKRELENPEGAGFTARCLSLGRMALGETEEQALEALKAELEKGIIKEVKEKIG